jgi:hypothetical protein
VNEVEDFQTQYARLANQQCPNKPEGEPHSVLKVREDFDWRHPFRRREVFWGCWWCLLHEPLSEAVCTTACAGMCSFPKCLSVPRR